MRFPHPDHFVTACEICRRLQQAQQETERLKAHLREAAEGNAQDYDARAKELEALHERIKQLEMDAVAMEAIVQDYNKLQRNYELKVAECEQHERVNAVPLWIVLI